jgi:8-oxo-dGTP diphosphatase
MKDLNYYETLPKKRMSVSAIFFNKEKHILIVKPTYRAYWLLPGGCIEDDESPQEACNRETKEELNIDISVEQLLGVDYLAKDNEETECLQFTFYGGILSQTQIYMIALPVTELSRYCFLPVEKILPILSPKLAKGLPYYLQALKENTVVYLENGHKPSKTSKAETD